MELFSYKRYFTWFGVGVFISLFVYIVVRISNPPDSCIDSSGRVLDLAGFQILHGISLVLIIIVINYVDTRTRTYFFEVFVFFIATALPAGGYFIA